MRANEIFIPDEFMEDIQFKIDVYNACVNSGLFNQRWNHNFHAENLVKKFAMKGTPFYEMILCFDKPLDDLASAIGPEPWVA